MFAVMAAVLPARFAGAASGPEVVAVHEGTNQLSLGEHAVLAVRARRENYNAHSFDLVSFYFVDKRQAGGELNLMPFFGSAQDKEKERDGITVGGGADCLLRDFRVVQAAGKRPAQLIVAERDFGSSYIARETVRFTYYELTQNADGLPGWPPLYFQAYRKRQSREKYCDVNLAFDRELHLGKASNTD